MKILIAIALMLAAMAAEAVAANEFEVQSSSVPAFKAGDKISTGTKLTLPEGAKITIIDRTGAAAVMRECQGKYDGPIEKCPAHAGGAPPTIGAGTRGVK